MRLKDLFESGLVKDKDELTVSRKIRGFGSDVRNGQWFSDGILSWLDEEIAAFTYARETGWLISLR